MFEHHPDGHIYVGAYHATLAEFLKIEPNYTLPDGFRSRTYIPGQRHSLFTATDQHGGPFPWPEGDTYLSREATYLAAQAAQQQAVDAEAAALTAQSPDGPAFIKAVMQDAFGSDPSRIDAVWKLCPVWWPAAKEENWPLVRTLTTMARSRGDITQLEYDEIMVAASAHHIPV